MLTITPFPCLLHFKQPAATSRGALRVRQVVFLRAERDGVVGWGECGIVPGLSRDDRADYVDAVMEICAAVNRGAELVNRDQWAGSVGDRPEQWSGSVGDRPERWAGSVGDRPERWSGSVGDRPEQWSGSVGDRPERERGDRPERPLLSDLPSVAFGLETARLDLAGGGRQRLFDTPFSRGQAALPTHGLIWMDTPAGMLAQIEGKIASGCRVIKLKVGALPFEQELALLAELRRRRPPADVELRLDANGAWTAEEARERLARLAEFTPTFLEQPIAPGQPQAMAALCASSPVPIALDEELIHATDPAALLATIRPQHIVLKPSLLGGLAACQGWIDAAGRLGAPCEWWINSLLESSIGLNAIAQWSSSLGDGRVHGLGTGQLFADNIPSPLRLEGCGLRLAADAGWDLAALEAGAP